MTLESLFKKRKKLYYKKLLKYGRYIFNDHFSLVLFFLIGAGGYAYSNYLDRLSSGDYQVQWVLLAVFFFLTTMGSVTLIVESADQVFLLAKEEKFYPIFKKEIFKSYLQSLILILLAVFISYPIFLITVKASQFEAFLIFLALASLKWLNLIVRIYPYFFHDERKYQKYFYLTKGVSLLLIFFVIFVDIKLFSVLITLIALLVGYLFISEKIYFNHSLRWDLMIAEEEGRLNRLYRLIAVFVDIPQMENGVKALTFMDPVIQKMTSRHPKAPYYYSLRTMIRNTEYRSLIVRLNVFAVIFIFLSNSYLLSLVFTLIFIYLLGFQLISLIQMNQKLPQFKILPVDDEEKITSSLYLMNQILLLMTFLIGITAIVSMGWKGLSIIPVGILMSYLFSYYYVPYRLKSNKRSR